VVSLHAGLVDLEPGSELTEVALVELDSQESQEEDILLGRESRLSVPPLDIWSFGGCDSGSIYQFSGLSFGCGDW
jgi:hypothetical protein